MMEQIRTGLRLVLPTALLLSCGPAGAQTYKYFHIFDVAHQCYLGGGKSYDGFVYHYRANDLGDHAQWRFEPADSGTYYLVDRRHGAALSTDYLYNVLITKVAAHVRDYPGRNCCKWRAGPATTIGSYWLTDQKYGLCLVAGDSYDGQVYIQAPGQRRNAHWVLTMVENGSVGPAFFVVGQQLLQLTLDTNAVNRVETAPLFTIDQTVNNGTGVEQSTSIEARKTETTAESWTFERSVSVSVAVSVQSGVSVKGVAEISSSVTTTYEESFTWTSAVEITKTTEYLWSIPVVVPPHSGVRVSATIKKFVVDLPFTTILRSSLGDGTVRIDTISGTWHGVEYLTGKVDYQEITGVDPVRTALPRAYYLSAPFPNPFNPSTTIRYGLPQRSHLSLAVYNTLGQQVAQLASGEVEAGYHEVEFDASALPAGVYFCRLQVRGSTSPPDSESEAGSPSIRLTADSGPRAKSSGYVETRKLCLMR